MSAGFKEFVVEARVLAAFVSRLGGRVTISQSDYEKLPKGTGLEIRVSPDGQAMDFWLEGPVIDAEFKVVQRG